MGWVRLVVPQVHLILAITVLNSCHYFKKEIPSKKVALSSFCCRTNRRTTFRSDFMVFYDANF